MCWLQISRLNLIQNLTTETAETLIQWNSAAFLIFYYQTAMTSSDSERWGNFKTAKCKTTTMQQNTDGADYGRAK